MEGFIRYRIVLLLTLATGYYLGQLIATSGHCIPSKLGGSQIDYHQMRIREGVLGSPCESWKNLHLSSYAFTILRIKC